MFEDVQYRKTVVIKTIKITFFFYYRRRSVLFVFVFVFGYRKVPNIGIQPNQLS